MKAVLELGKELGEILRKGWEEKQYSRGHSLCESMEARDAVILKAIVLCCSVMSNFTFNF